MNEEHIPGTLGGRSIFWCPDGEGYLPYCPQPTDPDDYNYCCLYSQYAFDRPTCCRYALSTGLVIALVLSGVVATLAFSRRILKSGSLERIFFYRALVNSMDEHIADTLSGRRIYWCPGGNGFAAYCPRETDPDEFMYCCTYGYDWSMPTCCKYPLHTGLIYAMYAGAVIVATILIFLSCWFCPICPVARRVNEVAKEKQTQKARQLQNRIGNLDDDFKPSYFR
ncbi:unnamed protein product [Anisakis simplex]|uniref:Uncharacterized protein n=1 Tax=Anisakis simplex TaxID=6269 RepID=A0A0M3JSJ1_ANISI|nr:unnamed protein product [Anisakis simplex]